MHTMVFVVRMKKRINDQKFPRKKKQLKLWIFIEAGNMRKVEKKDNKSGLNPGTSDKATK